MIKLSLALAAAVGITASERHETLRELQMLARDRARDVADQRGDEHADERAEKRVPTEGYRVLSDPEGVRLSRPIYR